MTMTRMIGLLVAFLGVGLLIYFLLPTMGIWQRGSSGIGAFGPVQYCPGMLLIVIGVVVFTLSKPKLK
jgi:hypothetical protein